MFKIQNTMNDRKFEDKVVLENETSTTSFGNYTCISRNGKTICVADPQNERVMVYRYNKHRKQPLGQSPAMWDLEIISGTQYGKSIRVSGDGDTITIKDFSISAYRTMTNIFKWDGSTWVASGILDIGTATEGGQGIDINYDGTVIAYGNPLYKDPANMAIGAQGQVIVYEWDGSTWNQKGNITYGSEDGVTSPNASTGYRFGSTILINDDGTEFIGLGRDALFRDIYVRRHLYNPVTGDWDKLHDFSIVESTVSPFGPLDFVLSAADNFTYFCIAKNNTDNGTNSGKVNVYQWNGFAYVQLGSSILPDPSFTETKWGQSSKIVNTSCGLLCMVPSQNHTDSGVTNSGLFRIYKYNTSTTTWEQHGASILGNEGEYFGKNIFVSDEIDSEKLVIGVGSTMGQTTEGTGFVKLYDMSMETCELTEQHVEELLERYGPIVRSKEFFKPDHIFVKGKSTIKFREYEE